MASAIFFLALSFFAAFVSGQTVNSPRSFQSLTTTYTVNGKPFSTSAWYDSNQNKFAQRYTFSDSSTMQEVFDYGGNQRFQTCSFSSTCIAQVYNQDQWIFYVGSGVSGTSETRNSVPCVKFTNVAQPNNYTATLWFRSTQSGGFNYIYEAQITKAGETISFVFTNAAPLTNSNAFVTDRPCNDVVCYAVLDLVLVLDDSDSIDDLNWERAINFSVSVVNSFPTISATDVKISVVTFASYPVLQIPLSGDRTAIINALRNIPRQRSQTGISDAINMAQNELKGSNRPSVPKAMIVITDGQPNVPAPDSLAIQAMTLSASLARGNGTIIYAIGVGSLVQLTTLQLIGSSPSSQFVSLVSSFTNLNSIQTQLIQSVCIGDNTDSCNPPCHPTKGFCACGTCKCLQACGQGSINSDCSCNCNQPFTLDSNGVCLACNQTAAGILYCSGHGTVNAANCSGCTCTYPWTGTSCNTCSLSSCGNGVLNSGSCSCNCNPNWIKDAQGRCTICDTTAAAAALCGGHGTIINTTTCSECSCTNPWTGGSCNVCGIDQAYCGTGSTVNTQSCTCVCSAPWALGTGTPPRCNTCNWSCNSRGTAYPTCDGCNCTAANGTQWGGSNCQTCLRNQTFCVRGTINTGTCKCTCPGSSSGDDCSICTWNCNGRGTVNANCNGCNNCTFDCKNGTLNGNCGCNCNTNWAVDGTGACTLCNFNNAANTYCSGRGNVSATDCRTCATCQSCGPNGTPNATNCACICNAPWSYNTGTKTCSTCTLGRPNCGNHGTVNADCASCTCDAGTGWTAASNCTICQAPQGFCVRGNFDTTNCDRCTCPPNWTGTTCNTCSLNCNGRGTPDANCTTCVCTGGWGGTNCQTCTRDNSFCAHGVINSGTCTCTCPTGTGYTGTDCSTCAWNAGTCNNHGTVASNCTCSCTPPWTGSTCNTCPLNSTFCNGKGTVNADCATCTCSGGWGGPNCQTCSRTCVHGTLDATSCTCNCDGGWSGTTCATCNYNNASCGQYGSFNSSQCACNCNPAYEYVGILCNQCPANPDCGNGVVLQNLGVDICQCFCFGSWTGTKCNQCTLTAPECRNGVVDSSTCRCNCSGNWQGERCGLCPLTYCSVGEELDLEICQCVSNGTTTGEVTTGEPEYSSEGGTNIGAIVGGVVAGSVLLGAATAGLAIYFRKSPKKAENFKKRMSRIFGNVNDNPFYQAQTKEGVNAIYEPGHNLELVNTAAT